MIQDVEEDWQMIGVQDVRDGDLWETDARWDLEVVILQVQQSHNWEIRDPTVA
jgi:hypothetical protein